MFRANTTENVVETTTAATNGQSAPVEATNPKADPAKLARLTEEIKCHLDEMGRTVRQTTEIARQLGQKLIEVKPLVKAAGILWETFVKTHLSIEKRQAQRYVRLANRWEDLKAAGDLANLTIEQCLALLAKPNGPIEGLGETTSKKGVTEKRKLAAVEKPTDPRFCVASTSEWRDKKLQASELLEFEGFLAADSAEKKFVADKLALMTREIQQIAQKICEGKEGVGSDAAVVALALLTKIASEMRALPVVKVIEKAELQAADEAAKIVDSRHQLNGAVPA